MHLLTYVGRPINWCGMDKLFFGSRAAEDKLAEVKRDFRGSDHWTHPTCEYRPAVDRYLYLWCCMSTDARASQWSTLLGRERHGAVVHVVPWVTLAVLCMCALTPPD